MKLFLCLFVLLTLKQVITIGAVPSPHVSSSKMLVFPPTQPEIHYEIRLHNFPNPRYKKFQKLVGTGYALDALKLANEFAITTLTVIRFALLGYPFGHDFRLGKGYSNVSLSLESFREEKIGYADQVASTKANEILLNLDYMNDYVGDLHKEFTGILYHESTRVWQWTGNGTAPGGLVSGIADYVRLKAGFPSQKWASRGSGRSWDEGYAVTAYFLEYCNSLKPWFVAGLNEKMKANYSDNYFQDLLGKSVLDLWSDYKAVYQPVQYEVVANGTTKGDLRFKQEVGTQYATRTLLLASEFALKVLDSKVRQNKPYKQVKLIVESFAQDLIPETYYPSVARTTNNTIRLNSDYIQSFVGDLKADVTGILYHESTHVWQWTGNGRAPAGLVNGIADYVRLKAGWRSRTWPKRGSGQRWNEGYAVTAYFLEYCESLKDGFVSQLNVMMKYYYSPTYFKRLLGKDVEQLWKDYKSLYAGKAPSPAPAPKALFPGVMPPKSRSPAASPMAAPNLPGI
ncbi:hypothetical protein MLD38_021438 [Melastoma candidum]|uniref:Uncharacterized protein n=1 Tax=Melastoma candidum TaxID=119954 RepID=A0ACB9QP72_9MYRT|nr:hypothetical protein MLD38_021438 [Melastoma candidum]